MPKKISAAARKGSQTRAPRKAGEKQAVYQLKISLCDFKPLIWRRIQVRDCTLSKLHEHVQTAMGWTNSHLHHFRVGEQYYGDPELMQENFQELGYKDSTKTKLSHIVPADGKRFSFFYEYDFGDCWLHEILFERVCEPEAGSRYPVCVDGQQACPPDDCGGVWGYADLLAAISDPTHENHAHLVEWLGGPFDPAAFDPAAATKSMKLGMPGW